MADINDPNHIFSNGFTRTRIGSLVDWSGDDQGYPLTEDTLLPRVDDLITEYAENGIIISMPIHHVVRRYRRSMMSFRRKKLIKSWNLPASLLNTSREELLTMKSGTSLAIQTKFDTYANLVEQSTALIKEIDPDAKVIFGAVPGDWLNNEPVMANTSDLL